MAHPRTFEGRSRSFGEIGTWIAPAVLERYGDLRLTANPFPLADRVLFLGGIRERFPFESPAPGADLFADDTGLALVTPDGLVVLSGCAHAGICSIVAQAQRLTGEGRVRDVVGGLHLLGPSADRLAGTVSFFAALGPTATHPCHCTDFETRCALARAVPVGEVGVGLVLDYV